MVPTSEISPESPEGGSCLRRVRGTPLLLLLGLGFGLVMFLETQGQWWELPAMADSMCVTCGPDVSGMAPDLVGSNASSSTAGKNKTNAVPTAPRTKPKVQCPAFPYLDYSDRKTSSPVLLVALVFEPEWYLKQYLHNILAFTEPSTLILLHLSKNTNYSQATIESIHSLDPRIIISCARVKTKAYTGQITIAVLRSIAFARQVGLRYRHVLFWSSNTWFLRSGVEAYVQQYGSSLSNQIPLPRHTDHRFIRRFPVDRIPPANSTTRYRWNSIQRVTRDIWAMPVFHSLVAASAPPGSRNNFITFGKFLEGAFFTAELVASLLSAVEKTFPPSDWNETFHVTSICVDEFIFFTWADHHRELAGDGRGLQTAFPITQSSGLGKTHAQVAVSVQQIKVILSAKMSSVFGVKAVGRYKTDHHGTRAYLRRLADAALAERPPS